MFYDLLWIEDFLVELLTCESCLESRLRDMYAAEAQQKRDSGPSDVDQTLKGFWTGMLLS